MDFKEKYNREKWLSFLEDSFLPDDFTIDEKAVSFSEKLDYTQTVTKLGGSASLGLTVFEIKHKSTNDARVGLSKDAFRLVCNYTLYDRALILFVPQDNNDFYRFSLVEFTPIVNEKGKVKRDYSNPRRYSFILGRDAKVKTPQQYLTEKGRIKDTTDLKNRFSVEVLTKKFFSELFKWYDEYAMPLVKYPEGTGASVKLTQTDNNLHLIRLITRLIFVWFIKQKKLIPEWIFEKDKVDEVLLNFDPHSSKKGNYYNGILQNLFFATLNKAVMERKFTDDEEASKHYGIKTLYRDHPESPMFAISRKEFIKRFESVPFLNGGLFECLDQRSGGERQEYHDGFSRESKRSAFVPNALFWGTKDGSQEGIIELFSRYNFTIEENTPQDVDIALDPELLGKVFENLLGTFNPETQETARNESGSFYTPREIVDYMVDTSLKAYLKDKLSSGKRIADIETKLVTSTEMRSIEGSPLDTLFSYKDEVPDLTEHQITTIIEAINNCKIIDPACGSGAFPMGILHKLVYILGKLDPDNNQWRELQRKNALQQMDEALHIVDKQEREQHLKEIDDIFESNASDYGRKLYLIENCLFGVDIQPIAIQITKLRFFISLIVDQKTKGAKEDNYGILPLPNLETKFVAANTLIGVKKKDDAMALFENPDIEKLQTELLEIRHKHFSAKTAKQKISLREKDREVCARLARLLEEQHYYTNKDAIQMAAWDPYNQNRHSEFFDPYWMFGIQDGFDVVIGNPPYVNIANIRPDEYRNLLKSIFRSAKNKSDLYAFFIEIGFDFLNQKGFLSYIIPQTWKATDSFSKLREIIFKEHSLIKVVDLNIGTFTAIVKPMIVLFSKSVKTNKDIEILNSKYKKIFDIKLSEVLEDANLAINTTSTVYEKKLFKKIENDCISLEKIIQFSRGIKTSNDNKFILKQKKKECFKIFRGKNIKRFFSDWNGEYIWYRPDLMKEKVGSVSHSRLFFEVPEKLITQRVNSSMQLICAYDNKQNYYLDTTNVSRYSTWNKKVSLKYICGLLNSKIINYWYCNKFLMPTIGIYELHSIPIKIASDEKQKELAYIVDQIISSKTANSNADTSALEAKIDKIVYELYGLTDDEIKVIGRKE
ncbi:hypothetical protein FACS189447_05690 [Spirochaetia bacterium]|nr:hypothetical protein FACS189447_05690 [Spirochaetia bacterium]